MATFDHRIGPDGKMVYRVSIRRKGYATQTATFPKLSETKKWAQMTEGAILEGRHLPIPEAKQHTRADLINRYRHAVLPHKKPSSIAPSVIDRKSTRLNSSHSQISYA